jgi:hypothetical protein
MRRTRSPKALWCYCGKWVAAIRRLTAMPKLEDRIPTEKALGSTPDISQYCQFHWYEPVFYWERGATFPSDRKCLGRVAENYTREYEVEFADGTVQAVTVNVIAESVYSQVDDYGRSYTILQEITDHHFSDKAVKKEDGWVTNRLGVRKRKVTTQGAEFTVEWRDGSTSRIALKDLKGSNPVEVAEYKIDDKPAFAWWVRDVLKRRERTIKKLKTRKVWQEKMKFGIELPRTVQEALEIDCRTGTTFWRDAINKEVATVAHVFEFVKDGEIPGNYQFVLCHMVFDVEMDLTRKARFIAGGHMTDPPKDTTYLSVVSRDSIRISFLIAALNDLDILACDIQGAYLNAETKELIYTVAGLEHGAHRE